MAFSYKKLWIILIERGLTKEKLRVEAKLSPNTIAAMGKNQGISSNSLEKICKALGVQPGDIMEYVEDESLED